MKHVETANASPRAAPVYEYDASQSGTRYALNDLKDAFRRPALVTTLIRSGFVQRHAGVLRAVFWIASITAATVLGLGLIYGEILGTERSEYLPYVATGIITWGLIASLLNDGAGVFIAAQGVYGQTPIAKSLFAIRAVGIAALTYLVKLPVLIGVLWWAGVAPDLQGLALAGLGLLLLFWTGFWFALAWGTIGARFHDLPHLTNAVVVFSFFVTPVFWQEERLGQFRFIVDYNPLYHFIHTVRGSLLGYDGLDVSFIWVGAVAVAMTLLGSLVFGGFARRLNYWN